MGVTVFWRVRGARIFASLSQAGSRKRIWRMPASLLRGAGRLGDLASRVIGQPLPLSSAVVGRLLDAECYSADAIRRELGWTSGVSLADGLRETLGPEEA